MLPICYENTIFTQIKGLIKCALSFYKVREELSAEHYVGVGET